MMYTSAARAYNCDADYGAVALLNQLDPRTSDYAGYALPSPAVTKQ